MMWCRYFDLLLKVLKWLKLFDCCFLSLDLGMTMVL